MPRGKLSKGKCAYCDLEFTRRGVAKHLNFCPQRLDAVTKATEKKRRPISLYHLHIQAVGISAYWMELEMEGTATLEILDDYLRDIWLECCDHMSGFYAGGRYRGEIRMSQKVDSIFAPGVKLTHIYDFGTESETLVKVLGVRVGHSVTPHPIALMARNMIPVGECIDCGQPASWFCLKCLYEDEVWGTLCDEHVKTHPHAEEYELVQLANSPRFGVCGYTGPAEPPY